ncbi:hypothetical protein [Neisseria wadsworthii]|uniref:ATP phosphoribosyltransferase regulatory subunit n=1 Tax=Neisseria wadsworthii 9715 TaxID=1030841 RepID=G4CPK8_9NEIS|nr:hypothetical protein [Neisseria wadsworthii]EGZ47771.1 ATP phosphoribosyltransferase regulatory subunit [Neisseria wadsworthii 9715]
MVLWDEVLGLEIKVRDLKEAVDYFEKQSHDQLKAGAQVIESNHSKEDYYLEVFDNGVIVEGYFDL